MRPRFNNLDELRLILAAIVAIRHIIVLAELDEFYHFLSFLSSEFAVSGFFVLSGFLVFSAFKPGEAKRYALRRCTRIYPAYLAVLVVAVIAGLLNATVLDYVSIPPGEVVRYLLANGAFLNFVHPNLGNLFSGQHLVAVNGALWTIKIEVLFYLIVPVLALLINKITVLAVLVAMTAIGVFWPHFVDTAEAMLGLTLPASMVNQLPGYLHLFAAGIALSRTVSGQMTVLALSLLCVGTCVALSLFNPLMPSYYMIVLPVMIYVVMQLPQITILKRNDFSYGLYLFHWPVAQFMVMYFEGTMPDAVFFAVTLAVAVLFSVLSWFLIERPMIRCIRRF
jgi:peptidoglycan/LPS O-acetylase OafA/YrhL